MSINTDPDTSYPPDLRPDRPTFAELVKSHLAVAKAAPIGQVTPQMRESAALVLLHPDCPPSVFGVLFAALDDLTPTMRG